MGVLMDENSRVVVQGFGGAGQREAVTGRDYGTNIVCGVTPGRGGQTIEGFEVLNTVREAVEKYDANVSLIFVPAPFAAVRQARSNRSAASKAGVARRDARLLGLTRWMTKRPRVRD